MFRDVVENVGLQRHLHVDGTGDPNQLALSDVEHTIDFVHFVSANLLYGVSILLLVIAEVADLETIPCFAGNTFYGGLENSQASKVHVGILLLIVFLLAFG